MSKAMNQHKKLAMGESIGVGKAPTATAPTGKFKKGGKVKK